MRRAIGNQALWRHFSRALYYPTSANTATDSGCFAQRGFASIIHRRKKLQNTIDQAYEWQGKTKNKRSGLCIQRPLHGGLYPDFLLLSPFLRPVLACLRTYPVLAIENFFEKLSFMNGQVVRLGAEQGRKPTLTVDFLKQALAVGVLARAPCLPAAALTSELCRR
jgi:hypothetical protein